MSVMRSVLLAGSTNPWLRERATKAAFVRRSVRRFWPGERVEDALAAARELRGQGINTILTALGENLTHAEEAEEVTQHYLEVFDKVAAAGLDAHVSVKPTQLGLDLDRAMCERIGTNGLPLIPDRARVLTHCNAGALATAGIGTALAPIYLAASAGRRIEVLVDETRPLLQGSRLTSWELTRAGIPVTVIADNMAASLMRAGRIDLCIVGADRIARNGDVANKVGTYGVAVAAHHHGIPMYVAAPTSTFDPATPNGDVIEIEQRSADEVRRGFGTLTAAEAAAVHNPAFDVTPAALITAIISDRGIHRPPYDFAPMGREAAAVPA